MSKVTVQWKGGGVHIFGEISLPGGEEIGLHPLRGWINLFTPSSGVDKSTPPPGWRNRSTPSESKKSIYPGVDKLVYLPPRPHAIFGNFEYENMFELLLLMCGHSYTPVGMATRLTHETSTKDLDVANIWTKCYFWVRGWGVDPKSQNFGGFNTPKMRNFIF